MLLYQICELAQQEIYLKLLKFSLTESANDQIKTQKATFQSMIRAIEFIHLVKINQTNFGFDLPYQLFKLMVPAMVDIRVQG